ARRDGRSHPFGRSTPPISKNSAVTSPTVNSLLSLRAFSSFEFRMSLLVFAHHSSHPLINPPRTPPRDHHPHSLLLRAASSSSHSALPPDPQCNKSAHSNPRLPPSAFSCPRIQFSHATGAKISPSPSSSQSF